MANLGKLFATLNQTYADSGIAHVSQIVRDLVLGGLLHVLGFWCGGVRLQPVQEVGGLLRVAGGGEDRPLVVFQDFQ